jgi:hypothetical protein
MNRAQKLEQVRRLGGAPGKGIGANTGLGRSDIVVPEPPPAPRNNSPESLREYDEAWQRWRQSLQAQLPVPVAPQEVDDTPAEPALPRQEVVREIVYEVVREIVREIIREVPAPSGGDHFVFTQATPSALWIVNHPLAKLPAVTVTDTDGITIEGVVAYQGTGRIHIHFNPPAAGQAILN